MQIVGCGCRLLNPVHDLIVNAMAFIAVYMCKNTIHIKPSVH